MSEPITIKSLPQLKRWNKNPTKEPPIVLDWFLDFFFEKLLANHNYGLAKDAYDTIIQSTKLFENLTEDEAKTRMFNNLNYYAGYSARWGASLAEFFRIYKI